VGKKIMAYDLRRRKMVLFGSIKYTQFPSLLYRERKTNIYSLVEASPTPTPAFVRKSGMRKDV